MIRFITNIAIPLFAAIGVVFLISLAGSFIMLEHWMLWDHYIGRLLIVIIVVASVGIFNDRKILFLNKKEKS